MINDDEFEQRVREIGQRKAAAFFFKWMLFFIALTVALWSFR